VVESGAGPSAMACTRLLFALGVSPENTVMADSKGVIGPHRSNLSPQKQEFATSRTDITTLAQAMVDADVFIGLSVADVLTPEMVRTMAPRPIVFALANPNPEISRERALASAPDIIYATGRSDYPNQINNVLGFPYIFRGALDCRAPDVNMDMKLAAAHAIAAVAREPVTHAVAALYPDEHLVFGPEYILPKPFDRRLLCSVPPAVAKAAATSGIARRPIDNLERYCRRLRLYVADTDRHLSAFISDVRAKLPGA